MGHIENSRVHIRTGIVNSIVFEDGVVPIVSKSISAVSYSAGVSEPITAFISTVAVTYPWIHT